MDLGRFLLLWLFFFCIDVRVYGISQLREVIPLSEVQRAGFSSLGALTEIFLQSIDRARNAVGIQQAESDNQDGHDAHRGNRDQIHRALLLVDKAKENVLSRKIDALAELATLPEEVSVSHIEDSADRNVQK